MVQIIKDQQKQREIQELLSKILAEQSTEKRKKAIFTGNIIDMIYQKLDEQDQAREKLSGMAQFKGVMLGKVQPRKIKKSKI